MTKTDHHQTSLSTGQRLFNFLIEEMSYGLYYSIFITVVIVLGITYALLSSHGQGIASSDGKYGHITFLQGIYFSIVTISSLGYGDMHPVGFSRILVCLEVLFGLNWIGIMIARVTSRRLSYHVQRLFGFETQRRLEEFSTRFEALAGKLSILVADFSEAHQGPTRNQASFDADNWSKRFHGVLTELNLGSSELTGYFGYEAMKSNYFSIAPPNAVQKVGTIANQNCTLLGRLVIGLASGTETRNLDPANRQKISEIIGFHLQLCETVERHSDDDDIKSCYSLLKMTCKSFPKG